MKQWASTFRARAGLFFGVMVVAALGVSGVAGATPTYDIAPVTTSISSELSANLPVILGIVGGLIALGLAVRAIRKFAKV
jgi:cell division protein FtsX